MAPHRGLALRYCRTSPTSPPARPTTMPSARPPIWTQGRSTFLLIAAVLATAALVETRTPVSRGVQRWLHDRAVSGARPVTDDSVAVVLIDAASQDRKSTRLNSSHSQQSRMPSSA